MLAVHVKQTDTREDVRLCESHKQETLVPPCSGSWTLKLRAERAPWMEVETASQSSAATI